ncbi:MAG: hypothetical protein K5873_06905 [Treponema sp.]|nr:hypothetical protein [Treponema sp.]
MALFPADNIIACMSMFNLFGIFDFEKRIENAVFVHIRVIKHHELACKCLEFSLIFAVPLNCVNCFFDSLLHISLALFFFKKIMDLE